jgi:hypothetical protein
MVSVGKPERSRPLGVYGRKILKFILVKWDGDTDWIDLAQDRQVAGSCEGGNKPSN